MVQKDANSAISTHSINIPGVPSVLNVPNVHGIPSVPDVPCVSIPGVFIALTTTWSSVCNMHNGNCPYLV